MDYIYPAARADEDVNKAGYDFTRRPGLCALTAYLGTPGASPLQPFAGGLVQYIDNLRFSAHLSACAGSVARL